jgi:opacity protein-like surface antigen
MKTPHVLVFAAALIAAAATARADFYTKLGALYDSPADLKIDSAANFRSSIKGSLGYSASLGYKVSLVRAEVEVEYFKNSLSNGSNTSSSGLAVNGDYKQYSGFVNAYLDVPSFFGLAPYVGAGLGMAKIDLDQLSVHDGASNVVQMSGTGKAYSSQVMLGLEFHVLGKATVNAGYRLQRKQGFDTRNYASNLRQNVSLGTDRLFEIGIAWGF